MNNKTNIFIPKKIKVGYQPRTDTYTKKLAYVIYYDGKGVLRKEKSWLDWIHNYMPPDEYEAKKLSIYNDAVNRYRTEYRKLPELIERYNTGRSGDLHWFNNYTELLKLTEEQYIAKFVKPYESFDVQYTIRNTVTDISFVPSDYDNIPLEGFVLNKKAGDYKSDWNHRQAYCRVYDPRGFEFEITIDNLLYILENTSSIIGKGLEGKFIYGWYGTQLVLIPEQAPEFQDMIKFTELKNSNFKFKPSELIKGGLYIDSSNNKVVFLDYNYEYSYSGIQSNNKVVFYAHKNGAGVYSDISTCNIGSIKKYTEDNISNLSDLLINLESNKTYNPDKKYIYKYELITKFDTEEHNILSRLSSWNYSICYILNKNGYTFKDVKLMRVYNRIKNNHNYVVLNRSRKNAEHLYEFDTLDDVLKSKILYKQIQQEIS